MGLLVWLPLNGSIKNLGLSDIVVTNNGATINNSGKIGQCYQFGTAASDITIPATAMTSMTTECSVCFWIKILSWNTSYATFFQAGPASTPWTSYIFGLLRNNTASTCCFTISNGSSASNASYLTPALELNTWYHIGLCYKTGHCLIYVNGILYQDYSTSIVPNFARITTIKIGRCTNGSSYLTNCLINDFRIYDHCLSDKEVEEIAKGLVLHYKLDNNGIGNENLLLNSLVPTSGNGATGIVKSIENGILKIVADNPNNNWVTFANHNTTLALAKGDSFTFSLMIKSQDSDKKPRVYFQSGMGYFSMLGTMSPNWSIIYYTGTWNIDNLATNIHLGFSSAPGTYYIRYFKLEKGTTYTSWAPNHNDLEWSEYGCDNNIVYDSSGYNNNGILLNTPTIDQNNIRYTNCCVFNGSNIAIAAGRGAMVKDSISICCWGYMENWGNYNARLLSCTQGGGWNFEPSSGKMNFAMGTGTSSNTYKSVVSTTTLASLASGWHFFVGTYNGLLTKIYIDGILDNTLDAYSTKTPIYYHGSNGIFIGAEAGGNLTTPDGNYFNGKISDVRIYATALTDEQILELYNTSATIDNKGNIYSREYVENSNLNITKTGLFLSSVIHDDDDLNIASILKTEKLILGNTLYEY